MALHHSIQWYRTALPYQNASFAALIIKTLLITLFPNARKYQVLSGDLDFDKGQFRELIIEANNLHGPICGVNRALKNLIVPDGQSS